MTIFVVKAKGHTWDAGKITKAATVHQTGVKTFACKDCGTTKTESIAKLKATATNVTTDLKSQVITTANVKAIKAKTLKKKNVSIKLKAKTSGEGKLSYKVTGYPKKMKKYISVKKGVVTIKKKAKKGTYKVTITAAATSKYKRSLVRGLSGCHRTFFVLRFFRMHDIIFL